MLSKQNSVSQWNSPFLRHIVKTTISLKRGKFPEASPDARVIAILQMYRINMYRFPQHVPVAGPEHPADFLVCTGYSILLTLRRGRGKTMLDGHTRAPCHCTWLVGQGQLAEVERDA